MFTRLFKARNFALICVWALLAAPVVYVLLGRAATITPWTSVSSEANYNQSPVINSQTVPPLVLMVMSRDEQLYYKAYTDYTDLHQGEPSDPGTINTTYDDTFSYAGYFDPKICYTYNSGATSYGSTSPGVRTGTGLFIAAAAASGANSHYCTIGSSQWSGNFLNWLTMSRLDIVRSVLYGGMRSIDTSTQTVLERAAIPNDLHAWSKVYNGSDINQLTPFSTYPVTFCNASFQDDTGNPASPPELRVASGNWSQWSSTERQQCVWKEDSNSSGTPNDDPSRVSNRLGGTDFYVRVDVCDETGALPRESFCRAYVNNSVTPAVTTWKPAGLLQSYGESGKIRFGLFTGSWADPRSGGRLRRNIGLFAGNGGNPTTCVAGDEVNLSNGTFCNQGAGVDGIVNTLNDFRIPGWYGNTEGNKSGDPASGWGEGDGWRTTLNGSQDCWSWGTIQRASSTNSTGTAPGNPNGVLDNPGGGKYHCNAWGNPLSEIYAEALRYIEGNGNTATPAFDAGNDKNWISGIPDHVKWIDPYGPAQVSGNSTGGGNPYCATCSILVLSTGLNSFDSDEIPTDSAGLNAYTLTNSVGSLENFNGSYLIGRVLGQIDPDTGIKSPSYPLPLNTAIDTYSDACTAKTLTGDLGDAIGICPDVPSLEGSYGIAGLAYGAWTKDLRPDLASGANAKPSSFINNVQTYAVQLAESLPSFNISVGGSTISFSPVCYANPNNGQSFTAPGYHTCSLGQVQVGTVTSSAPSKYIYGRPLLPNNTAGSFVFTWEDSTFGSDHDMDMVTVVTYCVGSACTYTNGQTKQNIGGGTYTGYDICWRSDSALCTSSGGKPTVGANQVLIRTEVLAESTGDTMVNGYALAGTASNDGLNRILRVAPPNFYSILTGNDNPPTACPNPSGSSSNCWDLPKVVAYTPGTGTVQRLQNPLFYAAKYGGFQPAFTTTGSPNSPIGTGTGTGVWDAINNITGATCVKTSQTQPCDGLPDNFFPVHHPSLLGQQLGTALNAILKRTGSGTAAAVVSNNVNGDGVVYRAQYLPYQSDNSTPINEVYWSGTLNSVWDDCYGHLRESNGTNVLAQSTPCTVGAAANPADYTPPGGNPIVVFSTDPTTGNAVFTEYVPSGSGTFNPAAFDPTNPGASGFVAQNPNSPLSSLKTIWDAQQQLWDYNGGFSTNLKTQRAYSASASTGRYIFTWIDANRDGVVNAGEQTPFVWTGASGSSGFYGTTTAGVDTGDFGFLNTSDSLEAQCIVDWIRGVENETVTQSTNTRVCGMRNRSMKVGSSFQTFRLGDIIDSTPLVISRPAEQYDLLYGDSSYASFRSHYLDRRQVIYVGANDGMLHAFNGGFYDNACNSLLLAPATNSTCPGTLTGGITQHPLGSEIWAYVPGNLLAHVRWLTDPAYKAQHVFYVDGSPVATDAKVFPANAADCSDVTTGICHPNGWGTILVVPFRLGGGMIQVPVAVDPTKAYTPNLSTCGTVANSNCAIETSYSAYSVFDVTDPEQPPVLLAELTPASSPTSQSFALPEPAFGVIRDPSTGNPSKFYLYIGSGPTGPANSTVSTNVGSNAALRVYSYDLSSIVCGCSTSATPMTMKGGTTYLDFSNGGVVAQGKNAFSSDLIASDFNLNERDEAVYFGSVSGSETATTFGGTLWKIGINENTDPTTWTKELMFDPGRPITIRPTLGLTERAVPEIYFGTGRLLAKNDLTSTQQQAIYGVVDPELAPTGDPEAAFTLPLSGGAGGNILNVTSIGIAPDGTVTGGPSGVTTLAQLEQQFQNGTYAGFEQDLAAPGKVPANDPSGNAVQTAERVVSAQTLLGGILITNTYIPGINVCTGLGNGFEYALDYKAGTASNTESSNFGVNASGNVNKAVSLGQGLPAAPSLHVGTGTGSREVTACTQTSTGAIICQKVNSLTTVQSQEISWREPLDQ